MRSCSGARRGGRVSHPLVNGPVSRAARPRPGGVRREVDGASLEPMRPIAGLPPLADPAWIYELKLDGFRLLADVRAGQVTLRCRSGHDCTQAFPEVVAALRGLRAARLLLDGEVVPWDEPGRPDFDMLGPRLYRSADQKPAVSYHLFDVVAVGAVAVRPIPLRATLVERIIAMSNGRPVSRLETSLARPCGCRLLLFRFPQREPSGNAPGISRSSGRPAPGRTSRQPRLTTRRRSRDQSTRHSRQAVSQSRKQPYPPPLQPQASSTRSAPPSSLATGSRHFSDSSSEASSPSRASSSRTTSYPPSLPSTPKRACTSSWAASLLRPNSLAVGPHRLPEGLQGRRVRRPPRRLHGHLSNRLAERRRLGLLGRHQRDRHWLQPEPQHALSRPCRPRAHPPRPKGRPPLSRSNAVWRGSSHARHRQSERRMPGLADPQRPPSAPRLHGHPTGPHAPRRPRGLATRQPARAGPPAQATRRQAPAASSRRPGQLEPSQQTPTSPEVPASYESLVIPLVCFPADAPNPSLGHESASTSPTLTSAPIPSGLAAMRLERVGNGMREQHRLHARLPPIPWRSQRGSSPITTVARPYGPDRDTAATPSCPWLIPPPPFPPAPAVARVHELVAPLTMPPPP